MRVRVRVPFLVLIQSVPVLEVVEAPELVIFRGKVRDRVTRGGVEVQARETSTTMRCFEMLYTAPYRARLEEYFDVDVD